MLGLDNPIHIAFLLILLLLVFGAKRLPELGRSLGAGMRGFKDSLTGESSEPAPAAQQPASAAQPSPPRLTSAPAPGTSSAVAPMMPAADEPQPPTAA